MSGPIPDPDRWRHRRRIVYGTLIFCAVLVAWLAIWAETSPLREQLSLALVGLAGAVIGAYVFGAAWDDKNMMGKNS